MVRKLLLVCGVLSSLLYGVMIGAIRFEGYSRTSRTVSELSAIGAPTRPLWMLLGSVYDALVIAFGLGVWVSARGSALCVSSVACWSHSGCLAGRGHLPRCTNVRCWQRVGKPCPIPCTSLWEV